MSVTAEQIRAEFDYCPITGQFERRDKAKKRRTHTGTTNKRKDTSYVVLCVEGKRVYGHRAAWMYVHGDIPHDLVIDHIDGSGLNNCIANLRLVTKQANQHNRRDIRGRIAGVFSYRGGFSVHFASRYCGWSKDYFEACCIRKSLEAQNGFGALA